MLTTLAQNLKLLKPERERSREKNQRTTGDWTLQITDEKELALYLDPWEESLLNFVMSHIYMEFCKSIQSMKKHYFYSHQKPTKLVYEICLIPIVLWGKLETSSWFLLYIGSAQLIRRRVKIDQLWICFSFWWNIFNNRLTAVRIDICYSLSLCLYWESFIAFNFIYISNKT